MVGKTWGTFLSLNVELIHIMLLNKTRPTFTVVVFGGFL